MTTIDALRQLFVQSTRVFKGPDALEVLLLGAYALIELLLSLAVLLPAAIELGHTLVPLVTNDTSDVLEVVQEHLPLFLLLGILVKLVDLAHVVQLLVKVLLGVNQCVEEVAVLAILFGLEVERVEEFEQALGELSDLNVGGTRLYLALKTRDLPVLIGKKLFLPDDLLVLLLILCLDLAEYCCMLLLLNLLLALLHLGELLLKSTLLIFAVLLQLSLGFGKSSLLFDQSRNHDDLVLLNSGAADLVVELVGLYRHLFYLFRVLPSLILKLLNFSTEASNNSIDFFLSLSLFFNT